MCTSSVAIHTNNIISATNHFLSASIPPSEFSGTPFKAIRLLLRRKATQSMWYCFQTRASSCNKAGGDERATSSRGSMFKV